MPTLGIIVGSTRPGRVGKQVADWLAAGARRNPDVEVDLIDLADLALPFLDEPHDASTGIYTRQHTRDWSARVQHLDAILLVTPEYNHSFPAPLKNALDYLSVEWSGKPVAMVGYGGTSSGTRAVQALLPVVTSLGMLVTGSMYVPFRQRLEGGRLVMTPHDESGAMELVNGLLRVTRALVRA